MEVEQAQYPFGNQMMFPGGPHMQQARRIQHDVSLRDLIIRFPRKNFLLMLCCTGSQQETAGCSKLNGL